MSRAALPDPLRAVSFDCWGTLLVERDWPAAHARRIEALRAAAQAAGRALSRERALDTFDAAWNRHIAQWTGGVATGAPEIARDALAELGLDGDGAARAALVAHWQEASHSGAVEAVSGARDCLAALARAGLRLALVCDTGLTPGRVVRRHLERTGLLAHLAACAFSDEVGVPKPDARPFRTALAALGVEPAAAVHVGDLLRTDVAGARATGMGSVRLRTVHDDPSALPEADAVVDSHAELLRLLAPRAR